MGRARRLTEATKAGITVWHGRVRRSEPCGAALLKCRTRLVGIFRSAFPDAFA